MEGEGELAEALRNIEQSKAGHCKIVARVKKASCNELQSFWLNRRLSDKELETLLLPEKKARCRLPAGS
jgi:hypothetical protein